MNILGIHDGHTATACLLCDGRVVGMISEERLNRVKNQGGMPARSIQWLLETAGLSRDSIDLAAFAGFVQPITDTGFYDGGRHRYFSQLASFLPSGLMSCGFLRKACVSAAKKKRERFLRKRTHQLPGTGKTPDVLLVEHHTAHACAAYFASGFHLLPEESLIITADGSGDGACCGISRAFGSRIELLGTVPSYHSPGILYSRVTQFLGMKPLEHEYKVMGLAPYVSEKAKKAAYDILKGYYSLSEDGLSFVNRSHSWGNSTLKRLQKDLFLVRFDSIASALQQLFEELYRRFILNWVCKTGIRRVVLGGGVFMNVKLNGILANEQDIEHLYILPSCSDESTAFGAACWAHMQHTARTSAETTIQPLDHLYLGYRVTEDEALEALAQYREWICFRRVEDIEKETARLLAEGNIVARVQGRMEWGARALGNRSILASPQDLKAVRRINAAIKRRDFWMPFAPSILWERKDDYLVDKGKADTSHMMIACETTAQARREMIAALHPSDLTCRPQVVRREANPRYHGLLKYFESITGIGGVLNTSFNLHGEPIVMTAEDALHTLVRSDLDYLTIEDYLVWRSSRTI